MDFEDFPTVVDVKISIPKQLGGGTADAGIAEGVFTLPWKAFAMRLPLGSTAVWFAEKADGSECLAAVFDKTDGRWEETGFLTEDCPLKDVGARMSGNGLKVFECEAKAV